MFHVADDCGKATLWTVHQILLPNFRPPKAPRCTYPTQSTSAIMAEIAAGAIVAEQVVSTGVQVAALAAVAAPTQPLKVALSQLARADGGDDST